MPSTAAAEHFLLEIMNAWNHGINTDYIALLWRSCIDMNQVLISFSVYYKEVYCMKCAFLFRMAQVSSLCRLRLTSEPWFIHSTGTATVQTHDLKMMRTVEQASNPMEHCSGVFVSKGRRHFNREYPKKASKLNWEPGEILHLPLSTF